MTSRRAAGALVIASMLWGTTGTAASFLPDSVSPLAIGAATMTLGGAALFLSSVGPARRVMQDAAARRWVLVGALGVFVYPLAFYSGMNLAGVAVGNVVALGSGPVFAALLEWVIDGDRPTRRWAGATVMAVLGIVLLPLGVTRGESDSASGTLAGTLLGLLAGASYALYTFASAKVISRPLSGHGGRGDISGRDDYSGRGVIGAMFGLGALMLTPVLVFTAGPILTRPSSIAISLYLAVGPMFLAYRLFGFALASVRSSVATTITLLEPVVATLLAVLIVGERLSVLGYLGAVLIVGGVFVVSSARRGRSRRHPA